MRDGDAADDGTMAEVVVRAAAESFTPIVLKELFLRVQEAQVGRLIVKLKAAVARDDSEDEVRLIELESMRRQISRGAARPARRRLTARAAKQGSGER